MEHFVSPVEPNIFRLETPRSLSKIRLLVMVMKGNVSTDLEWRPHMSKHEPEDFTTDLENLVDRARAISGYTEAEIELDSLKKPCRFITLTIRYGAQW